MMRLIHFLSISFISLVSCAQVDSTTVLVDTTSKEDTSNQISLLFVGDIMGHGPQITSAYNAKTKKYVDINFLERAL